MRKKPKLKVTKLLLVKQKISFNFFLREIKKIIPVKKKLKKCRGTNEYNFIRIHYHGLNYVPSLRSLWLSEIVPKSLLVKSVPNQSHLVRAVPNQSHLVRAVPNQRHIETKLNQ